MLIAGIDPGLSGAVAWIDLTPGKVPTAVAVEDMPVVPKPSGKHGNMIEPVELYRLLSGRRPDLFVVEQVHAMPKQGVASMFTFGRSLGVVEGVIAGTGVPIHYASPSVWKAKAKLTREEKDVARSFAIRLFPNMGEYLNRKNDIGRADALLIAMYGHAL